ncbi:MAG: radical SAM protein [Candidatus Lokiarchaeota archaeon]|nr:radical SAM protein [Candidatus Lokiarchaeota archaeon]
MKILYVNAGNAGSLGLDSFLCAPPLALMYLTPTVPEHKKLLVDLKANPNISESTIRHLIQRHDLVAISSYTPSIKNAMQIASIAKEYEKPVIIGGYHASLVPEVAAEPMFDVAVQNEGELTYPEVVKILERDGQWTPRNLKGVKGISYKNEGKLVVNEPRPLIKDLDTLPMPDRSLIGNTKYEYFGATIDALETSRGCVGQCNFCCVKEHTPNWRKKTPARVIDEIAALSRKTKWIAYQDSEFTINMNRVREICDLVIEHGFDNQWHSAQVRADDLLRDKKTFGRMVDAGFKMLFIGIESAHQRSLDRIGKKLSVDTVKQAIKMCHDYGVAVLGAIIIGNLGETYQDVLETIDYAKELDIDIGQFTALTPLPKTGLHAEAMARGWIEDHDWTHYDFTRVVMRTPDLTRSQIAQLVQKAYKDFYIGPYWGSYFFSKAKRYFSNRRNWWFFKMMPGFMKNIKPIQKLVTDLSAPIKIERCEDAFAKPSKFVMAVPTEAVPKKTLPIVE